MQKAMDALRPPVQTCTGGRVEVYAQCYGHLTTSTEHLARQLHQISITPTTLEVPRTCNIPLSTIDGTIGFAHSALEPQLLLDPRVQGQQAFAEHSASGHFLDSLACCTKQPGHPAAFIL